MSWQTLLLAALATFYAARVISSEDGPWGVFEKLRARWDSGYLGKGIRCIVCVSAYTAAAAALLLGLLGLYDVWLWPIVWLGLAGASVKIDLWWKR
jgi:hypothetical protein